MKAELAVNGIGYHPSDERMAIRCRDAVLYIVSITSGMRNDEAIGIEVGAWRKELRNGINFCWVTTVEHKTGKGQVEYLVPELTIEALSLLAKYSAPIRKELDEEIRQLASNRDFSYSTEHLLRLEKARKDANKLFLGRNTQGGKVQESHHVEALSGQASNAAFDRIAKAAGSDWPLRTHQCRRTYARCFV
ncbi:site-specific integrase, partial [Pseudomonas aeruginosa]